MTNHQHTLILCQKIKQFIQQHYNHLQQTQLAEKVRTQIIPILISLFFQNTGSPTISATILRENTGNIVNQIKCRLRQSYKQGGWNGKENIQYSNQEYRQKLLQIGINLQKYLENHYDCTIEDIIIKTLSVCKLINTLQKLSISRSNKSQIFSIYRQNKQKKTRQVRWLSKYAQIIKIRHCLHKFHTNFYQLRNIKLASKSLHQFYLTKLYTYYTRFLQNLPLLAAAKLQWTQDNKQLAYRRLIFKSALNRVQNIYERKLRRVIGKIKKYNLKNNLWLTKWVRILVFRTPANVQTSFWRLKNFMKNQAEEKVKKNNKSLTLSQNQQYPNWELQRQRRTSIKTESLFTKKQQTQILCGLLQLVYKQRYFSCLVEAFTAIQLHSCSRSQEITSICEGEIINDQYQH